jgi:uncharacterized C2H2 Zn-finger protein
MFHHPGHRPDRRDRYSRRHHSTRKPFASTYLDCQLELEEYPCPRYGAVFDSIEAMMDYVDRCAWEADSEGQPKVYRCPECDAEFKSRKGVDHA